MDRRRDQTYGQAGSATYQRIMQRMEESDAAMTERMEAAFKSIHGRLDRIDRDLAGGEQDRGRLQTELNGLKLDLGELRDAATIGADKAAKEVTEVTVPAVTAAVSSKRWWEKWQAYAVAFVAFIAFYKNIGTLMRDTTDFWRWVIGEHPPAQVREDERGKT